MYNFTSKEVMLNQAPTIDESVMTLIRNELNSTRSFSSFRNNIDYDSGNTHVLGGFVDDELVCINVFMRMKFMCGMTSLIGYQSGFSSTSRNHRGKGLWSKLMKYSEDFLEARGASFIFGYPNPVSYPLFVKKLSYHSMNLHHLLLIRTLFRPQEYGGEGYARGGTGNHASILKPDLEDNIAWKQREGGSNCIGVYKFRQSFAWGKIRSATRLGCKIEFLDIGGMNLNSHADLDGLLKTAMTEAKVLFSYISLNEENEYFPLFKTVRNKYSPVIIKTLRGFTIQDTKLNFFGGMRDTY